VYSKKRTLADVITLTNKKIELPRDAVIDAIFLKVTATVNNAGASAWNGTYADVLEAIKEIRVVSDGNNVHYAINGLDAGILTYLASEGCSVDPDGSISVDAGASDDFTFVLVLNAGDILAVTKDSLELSMDFETSIATDVTLSAVSVTVTIEENVMTPEEFVNIYGKNLELSAEPKVVGITKSFDASDELREFFDLPTGTLLNKGVIIVKDAGDVRGGVTPSKLGIVVTTPDRREIYTVDYETLREINKMAYKVSSVPAGVVAIDYANEITADGYGIRAWKFNKGDYQLAVKSSSAGKIRYVSIEYVVNTKKFDEVAKAIMEAH